MNTYALADVGYCSISALSSDSKTIHLDKNAYYDRANALAIAILSVRGECYDYMIDYPPGSPSPTPTRYIANIAVTKVITVQKGHGDVHFLISHQLGDSRLASPGVTNLVITSVERKDKVNNEFLLTTEIPIRIHPASFLYGLNMPPLGTVYFVTLEVKLSLYSNPSATGTSNKLAESAPGYITATFIIGDGIDTSPLPPTCTTPIIPAQVMGPIKTHELTDTPGTRAGGNNFFLQFNDCSNQTQIRYRIDAHGTSPGQGLLPLITPSTAQGVLVQVLDAPSGSFTDLAPASIGQWRTIDTDQTSYAVPMQVRYYRGSGPLVPGTVHAAMTIVTEYQ